VSAAWWFLGGALFGGLVMVFVLYLLLRWATNDTLKRRWR
jgi:hypothetical protein